MTALISRFLKDESGATAIEYSLIAALVSIAVIGGASTLGIQIDALFTGLAQEMTNANAAFNAPVP